MSTRDALVSRLKIADLASTIGALVIGFGAGAWWAPTQRVGALVVGAIGIVLHSAGMYEKHRLERGSAAEQLKWVQVLYWLCWVMLAALAALWLWFRSAGS